MAKKNNQGIWIFLGIIVAAMIIGPYLQQNYTITNQEIINQLESLEQGDCSISLDSNVIIQGDLAGGTIDAEPNTRCEVYASDGTTWQQVAEGTTSTSGLIHFEDTLDISGTFSFKAICGDCLTNTVNLKVNPLISDTCKDSDGGIDKFTPGHVTIGDDSIYDVCTSDNLGLIEYYCLDNALAGDTILCGAGYTCTTTRSGAICSPSSAGGWEVGDTIYSDSGESGISGGTITLKYIDLEDYGFIPGGTCHPEVILHTYWDYQDAQACQGMIAAQAVKWSFYDSSRPNPRWARTDLVPPSNLVETIYPVSWDGINPWKLDVGLVYQIPGCNVQYYWDMKIKIAECD